jgi:hypothetical protein
VNVSSGITGGSITASPNTNVPAGTTVTITVAANTGYSLKAGTLSVQPTSGSAIIPTGSGTTYTFTMPASDVTISGEFEIASYSITISNAVVNGTITPSSGTAPAGTTIILTITPDENYLLKSNSLSVQPDTGSVITPTGSGTSFSFTMPASNVTVTAEFEEIPEGSYVINVNFEGFNEQTIDISLSTENNLLFEDYLTITVNGDFDEYWWYINGNRWHWMDTNHSNNFWINTSEFFIGVNNITVIVIKDNVPYSKEVIFRVAR